jgi:hypothetical protein
MDNSREQCDFVMILLSIVKIGRNNNVINTRIVATPLGFLGVCICAYA